MSRLPHPIPYQGSKRALAPIISNYVPHEIDVWYEPFAGSAAMSIWMARHRRPRRIVVGESLVPMADLWKALLTDPEGVARRYEGTWKGQLASDSGYFNEVRDRFNRGQDPVDLLYLLCRCVKNAVRFNSKGQFTQSVDKRRMGMRPEKMAKAIREVAFLLRGRTEVRTGDWLDTVRDAAPADFIYMDPPYLGTSTGRDRRYAEGMSRERLVGGLQDLRHRNLRFILSYDGQCGDRVYGPPLPADLQLTHLLVHAGRSSQATLNGSASETYESLYLSHGISAGSEVPPQASHQGDLGSLQLAAS